MVLSIAPFRLSAVIEAAMEIAGLGAAMKRLQARVPPPPFLPVHCMTMWRTV
jgi:hypothetical protein